MTAIFYLLIAIFLTLGISMAFLSTTPANLARILRLAGPVTLLTIGIILTIAGRGGLGIPAIAFAIALWQRGRSAGRINSGSGRKSTVRSAALEMELDHDSGEMDGRVLIGAHEGKWLSTLANADLMSVYMEVRSDQESVALLEAYLDRRMAGWRENADAHTFEGQGRPSASGSMTKQEAYQVLGLEPGATQAEIRKAWRKLMKSMHPDSGGSEFLAAKINAAKDILLD